MTGDLWVISPSEEPGEPPLAQQRKNRVAEQDAVDRAHPAFSHPLLTAGEELYIRDRAANVIHSDFNKD